MILAAIPIKPFGVAKKRLSPVLDAEQRSILGRAVAARTGAAVAAAGAEAVIVTGDDGVAAWAKELGMSVIAEDPRGRGGLNGAAATAARHAAGMGIPWAIIHADLPLADEADFRRVVQAAGRSPSIVASYDGGTNVITGFDPGFDFSFGPGSFRRHLARMPRATVVPRAGLALDLDTPRDLALARRAPAGAWLESVLGGP